MGNWYIYFIIIKHWSSESKCFELEARCGTTMSFDMFIHEKAMRMEFGSIPDGHGTVHAFKVDSVKRGGNGRPISGSSRVFSRVFDRPGSFTAIKPIPEHIVGIMFDNYDEQATNHQLMISS